MYKKGCHFPLGNRFTNLCLGIRRGQGQDDSLAPRGKGPYPVALTSPVAVKVAGVTPWILHMRVKRAYLADLEDAEGTTQQDPTDPRETKIILKKKKR